MKSIVAILGALMCLLASGFSWACSPCRPLVQTNVYNVDFAGNFLLLLIPLAVLSILAVAVHFSDSVMGAIKARLNNKGDKP